MHIHKILSPAPIPSPHGRPIAYDVRYLPNHKRKPAIIFIHGFKGFKDWGYFNRMADDFARAGFVLIKMNLSHNGTTPEAPTEFVDLEAFANNNFSIELDDLGAVIDHVYAADGLLPAAEVDKERIFLMGHSRGGSLAILKTREDRRVKGLVTLAAVSDLEQRWPASYLEAWKEKGVQYVQNSRTGQNMPMYYQIVEDYYRHRTRLYIPDAIAQIQVPFLVFHGTADETVPVQMAYDIGEKNRQAQLVILPGAGHTFGGNHPFQQTDLPAEIADIVRKSTDFLQAIS